MSWEFISFGAFFGWRGGRRKEGKMSLLFIYPCIYLAMYLFVHAERKKLKNTSKRKKRVDRKNRNKRNHATTKAKYIMWTDRCIYIYLYKCTHAYVQVHIYVCSCSFAFRMQVYSTYVCILYICKCTIFIKCKRVYMYICTHIHICVCIYIYAYKFTPLCFIMLKFGISCGSFMCVSPELITHAFFSFRLFYFVEAKYTRTTNKSRAVF